MSTRYNEIDLYAAVRKGQQQGRERVARLEARVVELEAENATLRAERDRLRALIVRTYQRLCIKHSELGGIAAALRPAATKEEGTDD